MGQEEKESGFERHFGKMHGISAGGNTEMAAVTENRSKGQGDLETCSGDSNE